MNLIYYIVLLFVIALSADGRTVYFDGEDGRTDAWNALDEGVINNIYNRDINSRVVSLTSGTYDIGLNDRSWNNRTERILSWDMSITGRYTIYVSVNTLEGHRWLFFNNLHVDVGFHGTGILDGIGANVNNGAWHRIVVDLDRVLQDTEPNNEIISVDGMRFGGTLGMIDNIVLDSADRVVYENGEGVTNWGVTDNTPNIATITSIVDRELVRYTGEVNGEQRVAPFDYAYNDAVIMLSGDGLNNEYTLGAVNGDNAWNNRTHDILQLKMRTDENFAIIVHILTSEGEKRLVYTPTGRDEGISADRLEIHHGLTRSRNGDNTNFGMGTDGRWQTYTMNLRGDLHDYDPDNSLISVNGISIRGSVMVDDIELLALEEPNNDHHEPESVVVYEDGEDGTIDGWRVHNGIGSIDDILNVNDETRNSRVIRLVGGGSYILGGTNSVSGWNNTKDKLISWKMNTPNPYTIYIVVDTIFGVRYLFYTFSPNRGLLHGFEGGVHHGLGALSASGRWRTITRDLEKDLSDAEPENKILAVNGFIYNGGDNGMIDDIVLYTSEKKIIEDGESGTDGWEVADNIPTGATITNIVDNDRQGRHLQGHVISFQGAGADNSYRLSGIESEGLNIIQWRFRNFGQQEILSADPDARGTVRDPNAFEFRISVSTTEGDRDLIYTLGAISRGLIEDGTTIHHGLGDDRIIGSIWEGDNPMNEMGLWQTLTRDLQEDIMDFEPNNKLVSINSFEVRNSGLVDDIKLLPYPQINNKIETRQVYEDAEDGTTDGWTIYADSSGEGRVTNVMDEERGSRVIDIHGRARADGFMLGNIGGEGSWNDRTHTNIRWSMNYSTEFTIYISVQTTNGHRYILYDATDGNRGLSGEYIRIGLGANIIDGRWRTITRNIQEDIATFEPDNRLISIDAFLIRGSGRLDDIETFAIVDNEDDNDDDDNGNNDDDGNNEDSGNDDNNDDDGDDNDNGNVTIREDAEDGTTDGWTIYADSSGEGRVTNVMDEERGSRVIDIHGRARADGFMLGNIGGEGSWNDRTHTNIRWSMNYSTEFTIYISVQTTNGHRYILYDATDGNRGLSGEYIRIGLGANIIDGRWRTITRNIQEDIATFEPDNRLISIDAFLIRGSGRLDNIETFSVDNGDNNDNSVVYEDAEDGTTEGWTIYADSSGEGRVTNVMDEERGSRVIDIHGRARADGFMLGNVGGEGSWNDRTHTNIRWSMNYSTEFTIYISVQTTNGHRYILYDATDGNRGLSGEYIRIGLGANIIDGRWRTITRNIQEDIATFEPDNRLISVDGFLVRGSGRFDDIIMFQ